MFKDVFKLFLHSVVGFNYLLRWWPTSWMLVLVILASEGGLGGIHRGLLNIQYSAIMTFCDQNLSIFMFLATLRVQWSPQFFPLLHLHFLFLLSPSHSWLGTRSFPMWELCWSSLVHEALTLAMGTAKPGVRGFRSLHSVRRPGLSLDLTSRLWPWRILGQVDFCFFFNGNSLVVKFLVFSNVYIACYWIHLFFYQ